MTSPSRSVSPPWKYGTGLGSELFDPSSSRKLRAMPSAANASASGPTGNSFVGCSTTPPSPSQTSPKRCRLNVSVTASRFRKPTYMPSYASALAVYVRASRSVGIGVKPDRHTAPSVMNSIWVLPNCSSISPRTLTRSPTDGSKLGDQVSRWLTKIPSDVAGLPSPLRSSMKKPLSSDSPCRSTVTTPSVTTPSSPSSGLSSPSP